MLLIAYLCRVRLHLVALDTPPVCACVCLPNVRDRVRVLIPDEPASILGLVPFAL